MSPRAEESELGLTSFGEFSTMKVPPAGIRIVGDVVAEWVTKTHEFFNGPAKTIVFSPTVEHGRELCAAFAAAGFNFQQVSYLDRSEEERAAKIEEFRRPNSQIHGLVSCGVLTKGFDVPDCPDRHLLQAIPQEPVEPHAGDWPRDAAGSARKSRCGSIMLATGAVRARHVRRLGQWRRRTRCRRTERERTEITREKSSAQGMLQRPAWQRLHRMRLGETGSQPDHRGRRHADRVRAEPAEPSAPRGDCLKDPRAVWNGALNYAMDSTTKGEAAARKWAAGIWYGIYPGQKLPFGWFDMPRQPAARTPIRWLIVR